MFRRAIILIVINICAFAHLIYLTTNTPINKIPPKYTEIITCYGNDTIVCDTIYILNQSK